MDYINGHDLYNMFKFGTYFVTKKRQLLNDINVFPVPDGDTGNNLVNTLDTITRESQVSDLFYETLESIGDAALIGARGNSGVIFAQFVNGLLNASPRKDKVSIQEFTQMALESVEYIYEALANPVEGTMLTVITDWANGLNQILDSVQSVQEYFSLAFDKAERSLEKTKNQLAVLKKNKVVDSGAMGFVIFLKGINSYFRGEKVELEDISDVELNEQHHFPDENIEYRYCTEGLVEYQGVKESEISNALNELGDSLIVVMGKHLFRIHIHTNFPEIVFDKLRNYGKLISQKVDDMIQDYTFKHSEKDTVIVTDSIADLPRDFVEEHEIVVLPTLVSIDQVDYQDKVTINNEILFKLIDSAKEYPTSSTPTMKDASDLFAKLSQYYKHIIVILVAEKLSATYQVVKNAADKYHDIDIHVIDSYQNSVSEGLLVRKAALMLEEGKSVKEIVQTIEVKRENSKILVCLDTFKYAMKSGRLPKIVGRIGMLLGLRPIMTLGEKGKAGAFGFAFSQKAITKKIVKYIRKELEKNLIEEYAIIHCLNPELLETYRMVFTELIGKPPVYVTEVSSVISIHSGKGSVAIGYIKKNKR